jgi:hypothetical protein
VEWIAFATLVNAIAREGNNLIIRCNCGEAQLILSIMIAAINVIGTIGTMVSVRIAYTMLRRTPPLPKPKRKPIG